MRLRLIVAAIVIAESASRAIGQPLTDEQAAELARHFGFGPLQMYKFDPSIGQLKLADLNGDGRLDILLWSSHKSRFELLYQPDTKGEATAASTANLERNEVSNRGNLRSDNIPVAYRVSAMDVADVTGDGVNDIVFFGEPREVVILAGKQGGGFAAPIGMRAPEGSPQAGCLAVGDYNGDKRADVALLGEQYILLFMQKTGGGLEKPQRLVHTIKQPLLMLSGDFDGDGRDDLVVGSSDETYGMVVRLGEAGGTLGPQRRVKTPMLRSMTVVKNAERGDDLICVQHATNRMLMFSWEAAEAVGGGAGDWPERVYGYPSVTKGKQRPIAVGDVTGDGLADVVAADPDGAQLYLFEQKAGVGLTPGVAFPGLMKTIDVSVADVDNDGKNEVLSVSSDEKLVGLSRFSEGRLTFPSPYPVKGTPFAVTATSLKAGEERPTHIGYAANVEGKVTIRMMPAGPAEKVDPAAEIVIEAGELKDDPAMLRFADVNQDGRNDALLFIKFGGMQVYIQNEDGKFTRLSGAETREGMLREATPPGFFMQDVTGDGKAEVLLTQKNLVRALVVKEGQWTVVDQYNPESGDAEITGVAAMAGPQANSPMIAMYDRKSKEIAVLTRRADKTYAVTQTMPGGTFELTEMFAAPVGGTKEPVLVLADAQSLSVFSPGEKLRGFVEKQAYETAVKDAWLSDAVAGDLNHDGVRDIAVLDAGKAHIDVLTTMPDGRLVKATRFQVFQGKRFSDSPESRRQPREALIGDVTSDQIDDLVVLAHDRVIVYPGQ